MRLSTRLFRTANSILSGANLEIKPIVRDLDARLLESPILDHMMEQITTVIQNWLNTQTMFEVRKDYTLDDTRLFYEQYLNSAFRRSGGGSRFNNLLSLYFLAKCFDPTLIVDSGTFRGASAWAFALAAPSARILSFDIDMTRLIHREKGVEYIAHDWAAPPLDIDPNERSMAYFDDHVDQCKRLLEAHQAGVDLSIFDDDFTITTFVPFAHGGFSLPKVEFVLDERLRSVTELRWREKGKEVVWPVDVSYLDAAKATIDQTERLPDTSKVTGLGQLPYRVVKMAKSPVACTWTSPAGPIIG